MKCCEGSALACAVNDRQGGAALSSIDEEVILAHSHKRNDGSVQTEFIVPTIHCIACIRTIEQSIGALVHVHNVRANLSLKRVQVIWDPQQGRAGSIIKALDDTGFEHQLFDLETQDDDIENKLGKRLLLSMAVAGFATANIMLLSISVWSGADGQTAQFFHLVSALIAIPAVFYAGQPFFHSALSALKLKRLNMDVPISLAVLLALGMSLFESLTGGEDAYFDAAVTLLFFLLIGRYLDHMMREKARSAVVQLAKLSTKGANRIAPDGTVGFVRLDEIKPGDFLQISAGERLSVDGVVCAGTSTLNRSLVTGESEAVQIKTGDWVEAGTLNISGSITIEVKRDARHSFLAEVSDLIASAENGRGKFTRIADRMAGIYAPAVHGLAALTFLGWIIFSGDWRISLLNAIAVLIITCPCALGLAVPVVHVIGANRLFGEGIFIKDGSGFERMETVDHVVLDKTGTLTQNTTKVHGLAALPHRLKSTVHALATQSSHPTANTIAQSLGKDLRDKADATSLGLKEVREIPGFGIEATFDRKKVRLGRTAWVQEISSCAGVTDAVHKAAGAAFGIEDNAIYPFVIEEQIRPDAQHMVRQFNALGIETEILSGDRQERVAQVATQLGIAKFSAELTPAQKLTLIEKLRSRGLHPLMVGDGINDGPALAAAWVSVAPGSASDVSKQAADFVFTRRSLSAINIIWQVSRWSGQLVRTNFGLAIAYNLIAVPFAIAGLVSPLAAALAMSASSIVVVTNSLRLTQFKLSKTVPGDQISDSAVSPGIADKTNSVMLHS